MKGRAAVFVGKQRPLEIREYALADPGPGEIVVRVSQANVCGSDLHQWRGDIDLAEMGVGWPIVLGHEMTGRVLRLGKGADVDSTGAPLAEGDRVVYPYGFPCQRCRACLRGLLHCCPMIGATLVRPAEEPPHFCGGFADYYVLPRGHRVFKVPDVLGDDAVAGANCALSQVLFGLEKARLQLGESVVVQGAGGLGLYACAAAREMGAGRIVVLDAVPARLEAARAFGADVVIDVRAVADPRARVAQVMDATDHWGGDVVMELVGRPEVVPEGIRMLAPEGRYLEIGNISPRHTYKADPSLLVRSSRNVLGLSFYPPRVLKTAIDFLVRAAPRYPFERIASRKFELARVNEAFAAADAFATDPAGVPTRAAVVPEGAA